MKTERELTIETRLRELKRAERERRRERGFACPGCGRRFVSRPFMLAHALGWDPCRKVIPAHRLRQIAAEYRQVLASASNAANTLALSIGPQDEA